MKKSLRLFYAITCVVLLSCGKSDDTSPEPTPATQTPNFFIGVRNNTDNNVSCKTRQLVRVELVPSDSSGKNLDAKFTLNPAEVGMYSFYIPTMASYDIKVYTNNGQYVRWEHISLAPNDKNSANIIQIGTKNSDYVQGSMMSGLVPEESTIDCN